MPPVRSEGSFRPDSQWRLEESDNRSLDSLFQHPHGYPSVLCMRTPIDIEDALPIATKSHAANNRTTLRAAVEQALRESLSGSLRRTPTAQVKPAIPIVVGGKNSCR